jgi:TPR repeat protein
LLAAGERAAEHERQARLGDAKTKQCDEGDLFACGMLGEDLVEGKGVGVDRARGIALLEKACAGKQELACTKLAQGKGRAH